MRIFLVGSMNFYPKLIEIQSELVKRGLEVEIPISAKMMIETGSFDPNDFKGKYTNHEKSNFFRDNMMRMKDCDAILVINEEKNGISGYVGTSVLMEIGIAFYLNKKIFLWNPLPSDATYKPEIDAFGAIVINQDLSNII